MRSLNLFVNPEITSLRFLWLFGSVFATFWMLLDLMWAHEKAESSFCSVTRFAAVAVAIFIYLFILYFNLVENHKKRNSKKNHSPVYTE